MTNSVDFSQLGADAGAGAWEGILDFLSSFFEEIDLTGMPGSFVSLVVEFIGSFAVIWALWYGFKALRKAFSKANF